MPTAAGDREARFSEPVKDLQTVTPDGRSVKPMIHGVIVHRRPLQEDERGEIVEVYRPSWGLHPDPLVYVYQISVRPGAVRGWVVHRDQDDRVFLSRGTLRWALYDDRQDSPTHRMLNVITVSERNRALIVIPRGVYHGVQNIGEKEATFLNMPTKPYHHEDPDKYRLPLKNDLIPFAFDDMPGW